MSRFATARTLLERCICQGYFATDTADYGLGRFLYINDIAA